MSNTAVNIEKIDQLNRAAGYLTKEENPMLEDGMYRSFVQMMVYRRTVARELLKTHGEEHQKNLEAIFEDCNNKIKEILGL